MKLYNELAPYYFDIESSTRIFKKEIEFLNDVLKRHRIRTILDIGCGSGEHVNALQGIGYTLLGIDNSSHMIDQAKKKYPHCKFDYGSMQDYKSKNQFDSVICMFGTFNYLLTDDDIKSTLRLLQTNLKTAGIAILDIWNAEPFLRIKRKPIAPVCSIKSGDKIIKRNRGFRLTRTNSPVVEVNYVYHIDKQEIKDKHSMRIFYLKELKYFMDEFKFEILNLYGNFDQERFKKSGGRILLVVKKKT